MADDRAEVDDRQEAQNEERDSSGNGGGGGGAQSVFKEIGGIVREAAMEVLAPAARQATGKAAKYAVQKGPELIGEKVMPALEENGGPGGLAGAALGKAGQAVGKLAGGGGGGKAASGWGKNRRMPIQQWVYVSAPVREVFNGWTEYKQWSDFMHRVNQIDTEIDEERARIKVTEKMWGFTRPFTAEITSQKPDEHIRWKSVEGPKHTGTVNFHELGPRLTLVEVNIDHSPSGLVEKTARGTRFVKRAIRADLHRFQGWIEMKTEDELDEMEGWRGTIEGGKVTVSHEDAVQQEEESEDGGEEGREDGDVRGEEDEDVRGEEEEDASGEEDEDVRGEEDEDASDEEDEDAYDEEPEEPEASEDSEDSDDEESEDEEPAEEEEEPEASSEEESGEEDEEESGRASQASRRAPARRRPRQTRSRDDSGDAKPTRRRRTTSR